MSPSNLTILAYEETPLGPICLRRRELLSAPGTVVTEVGAGRRLRAASHPASERWDLILIDVDHAPDDRLDEASGRFYTEEGLRLASRHLAPGGVLGVWSYAESSPFARSLEATFEEVHLERVTFYVDMVEEERTDWLFFARSPDLPGVTGT